MTITEIDGLRQIADDATDALRAEERSALACALCGGDGLATEARERVHRARAAKETAERAVIIALRAYWAQKEDDAHGQQT